MVVFVCSSCNSSLRINQVAIHSCNSKFSCFSCNEEYSKQNVKSHIKCISEAEKYKGIDFNTSKNENKNIEKRSKWFNAINDFFSSYETTDINLQKVIDSIKNQLNIPDKENSFYNFVKNKVSRSVPNTDDYAKHIWTLIGPLKDGLKKPNPITKESQVNVETQKRKIEDTIVQKESKKKIKLDPELLETKKKPTKSDKKMKEKKEETETCEPKEKKSKKSKKDINHDVTSEIQVKESKVDDEKQAKSKTKKNTKLEIIEENTEEIKSTKKKTKKLNTENIEEKELTNKTKEQSKDNKEKKPKDKKLEKKIVSESKEEENKPTKIKTKKNKKAEIVEEKIERKGKDKKTKKADEINEKLPIEEPKEKKSKPKKLEILKPEIKAEDKQIKSEKSKKSKKIGKTVEENPGQEIATVIDNDMDKPNQIVIVSNVEEKEKRKKIKKNIIQEPAVEKMEIDGEIPIDDKRASEPATNDRIDNDKENVAVEKTRKSKKSKNKKKLQAIEEAEMEVEEKPKKENKSTKGTGDESGTKLAEKPNEGNSNNKKVVKINKDEPIEESKIGKKKRKLN